MAAIAKFVSFDGGIAFSEQVMKFQKRGQESVIVPLDDIANVRVRRPQEDADGFIRIETADGQRYRIFFEDDQLQEAIQFKKRFDATVADGGDEHALAPLPEKAVSPRPVRQNRYEDGARPYREHSGRAPRKPIFKRWWFWAVCVVLVIGIVGAIVGGPDKGDTAPDEVSANVSQPAAPADVQSAPEQVSSAASGAVTVGDYTVEIKDAFKAADYEGKDAIVITYTWTNNSEETTSAMVSLMEKAFQDGVQLDNAILYDVDGYDPAPYMAEIRPGVSLDVQEAFVLRSGSPVEVEVSDLFGFADPATKTFDPNNL